MNGRPDAIPTPPHPPPPEDNSDTDSNPDEESPAYYQPIDVVDEEEDEEGESGLRFIEVSADGDEVSSYTLPNGYSEAERVMSSIELHDSSEEEDVEGVTAPVVSDSEILRAFSEDESRRTAPLPADQAIRVMEAMRGVAFTGAAPDWVGQVPEDQWIHQLRRIRESSSS